MMDFAPPDWNEPLRLEEHLAKVPADARNKGIIVSGAIARVKEQTGKTVGPASLGALADYPVRDQIRILVECADALFPGVPPREGLRRLGRGVFPHLRENAAGRLLFAVAGNNVFSAVRLIGRAYNLFTCAKAAATSSGNEITVELRNAWIYPESYQVGVYEGALTDYHRSGEITVRRHSPCDVDLRIRLG
jgi:uncharacterized protein (TIGR02265 family)